jgi:hypothetical protein
MRCYDPGNCAEFFVHNIERVDSLGSTSRIVFCVPKILDGSTINEVTLTLIVPTDQLVGMIGKLMQPGAVIICKENAGEEVLH